MCKVISGPGTRKDRLASSLDYIAHVDRDEKDPADKVSLQRHAQVGSLMGCDVAFTSKMPTMVISTVYLKRADRTLTVLEGIEKRKRRTAIG